MASWRGGARTALRRKIKATPFRKSAGATPLNASGVAEVGPGLFAFIDNHDGSALYELTPESGLIQRRPLTGLAADDLRDPEGLARIDIDGAPVLVASSSLCVDDDRTACEGLVRIRYADHGDLRAETMTGFRDWLVDQVPAFSAAARRTPDAGGLNVEGLAWDPRRGALLFGVRGPVDRGIVTALRVPVDIGTGEWSLSALGTPTIQRIFTPKRDAHQGIRDISYDDRRDDFLILLGRSVSADDDPFQLCRWDGAGETAALLDITFGNTMKPEGVTAYTHRGQRRLLVVDDRGGYAVTRYPKRAQ